jgi:hypothetical protein
MQQLGKMLYYQNPVKGGLVTGVEKYIWNNYNEYIDGSEMTNIGLDREGRSVYVKKYSIFNIKTQVIENYQKLLRC